jgi:hypothetical protein
MLKEMFWLRHVRVYILIRVPASTQLDRLLGLLGAVYVPVPIWIPLTPVNGGELSHYEPDSKVISLNVNKEAHGNRQCGTGLSQPVMSPFWIKERENEDSNMPHFNNIKCNYMKCMF